jgi:hypothetical protein
MPSRARIVLCVSVVILASFWTLTLDGYFVRISVSSAHGESVCRRLSGVFNHDGFDRPPGWLQFEPNIL